MALFVILSWPQWVFESDGLVKSLSLWPVGMRQVHALPLIAVVEARTDIGIAIGN